MSYTEKFSEAWQLLGKIYGEAVAANTEKNTGYFSLQNIDRAVVIIHPVDVNDVLDVDIEERDGTNVQSFHGGDHDTSVGTSDTKPTVIEITADELDVADGFYELNVEITPADTGGNSNDFVAEVWGHVMYKPAAITELDSVVD